MIIDCDSCVMDGTAACADCVVSLLLRVDDAPVSLDPAEERAIANLADAGLVSPLRLVPRLDRREPGGEGDEPRRSAG